MVKTASFKRLILRAVCLSEPDGHPPGLGLRSHAAPEFHDVLRIILGGTASGLHVFRCMVMSSRAFGGKRGRNTTRV